MALLLCGCAGTPARGADAPPRDPAARAGGPLPSVDPDTAVPGDPFGTAPKPFRQELSARFDNRDVQEVAASLSVSSGVDILPATSLLRAPPFRVSLTVHRMPLLGILDWVARLTDSHYEILSPSRVVLSRGYEWLDNQPLSWRRHPISDLAVDGGEDRLVALVQNTVRVLKQRKVRCKVFLHSDRRQIFVLLPDSGHRRVAAVLRALRETRPPAPPAGPGEALAAKLKQPVPFHISEPGFFPAVRGLAEAMAVNLGADPRDLGTAAPATTLKTREQPLADALTRLVGLHRLRGYRVEKGRGVWLYGAKTESRLYSTGRNLWAAAQARAHYARPIAERMGADAFEEAVRKNVRPAAWDHPAALLAYNKVTGRLLVIHDAYVQQEVAAFLKVLGRRGAE